MLLIMTDQQRYDHLSVHGGACRTPALERLARQGVDFQGAYAVCSMCSPARASIFTGRYPHKHGMLNNCDMFSTVRDELPPSEVLLSEPLRAAGYACGYVGKWHIGAHTSALDHGFEGFSLPGYGDPAGAKPYHEYLARRGLGQPPFLPTIHVENRPIAGYLDGPVEATVEHFLADRTIELMRNYAAQQRPFFLTLQFWGPHEISLPSREYAPMYPPADVPLWGSYGDPLTNRPREYRRYRDVMEAWYYGSSKLGPEKWRRITALYYAYNTMIDHQVGRVLDELDRLDLADNTVVLFTADHGNYSGARGGMFDKGVGMFEDTYHIPLLARWPGVAQAGTRQHLVCNMDIFATVLELAGAPRPANLDSRSLVPVLKNDCAPWPQQMMCQNHGAYWLCSQRMLRWRHYKYVFTPADSDELYDLAADPHELQNRIDDPTFAQVKTQLQRQLLQRLIDAQDPLWQVAEGMFRVHPGYHP